jgi:hypothetical protein
VIRDPRTFWLTVTNIALGLAVVVLILSLVTGTMCDFVAKLRKRRAVRHEIEEDMRQLFRHPHH